MIDSNEYKDQENKESDTTLVPSELHILVTDADTNGYEISKMSDFMGLYAQQLTRSLADSPFVEVVSNIPVADLGIINDVVQQIDCDRYEQAEKSFLEIYDDFKSNYTQTYCDNAYVNAVISNKKSLMDKYKIDFNCQILLPNNLSLDVLVLPTILFNILDNAIQASKETHKKFIYLKINYTNNFILVYMKNSNYQTNNTDQSGMHGYGTSIVEDIIQENEGICDWNNADDFFETTLMLKYKGAEKNVDRNSGR